MSQSYDFSSRHRSKSPSLRGLDTSLRRDLLDNTASTNVKHNSDKLSVKSPRPAPETTPPHVTPRRHSHLHLKLPRRHSHMNPSGPYPLATRKRLLRRANFRDNSQVKITRFKSSRHADVQRRKSTPPSGNTTIPRST